MRWSPYVEFRCGHDQERWESLTAKEQKEIYTASGKRHKPAMPPVVEEDESFVTDERVAFQIRIMSREELAGLPVFVMFW
jgi:hypothetical protein